MPANALHPKECSNPGCKKRYTIIEAVNYFNDRMKCYVCRFCGSELMDMPNHNDEEEDIQAMQNKIKDQMEAETPFHSSILGYIKRLNGKQIHCAMRPLEYRCVILLSVGNGRIRSQGRLWRRRRRSVAK